jgi:predicted metal-dependent phosphoesterase TrpH
MILADMHTHSTFSDGKMSIPELVDFYGQRGFGAIAVTDHICEDRTFFGVAASYLKYTLTPATFPLYMQILRSEAERAWDRYKMVVIAGYELSKNSWSNHRSAHILGLGIHDFIAADGDILDLARAIRAQGGLAIAAHPVSTRKFERQTYHLWNRRDELKSEFDAWEVASGPHLFDEVLKSGLPMIASSDLHHAEQINAWKTVLHCEKHPEAILDAIRKQELSFQFYKEGAKGDAHHRTLSYPLPSHLAHSPYASRVGNVFSA